MVSLRSSLLCAVVENTSLVIGVMELGAVWADAAVRPKKEFGGNQHTESRGDEIDPKDMPIAASKCRAKGPRRIHAHS